MIGRLTGRIAHESSDGTVVVDVAGVGYEVATPLGTLGRLVRDGDERVTLQVHTHVREDAIVLFGFADELERAAFRALTSVTGIGPRIAIGILGSLPAAELAATIARGDTKRLQAAPGVGKKLAERLALELKDKLTAGAVAVSGAAIASAPIATPTRREGPLARVVDTLVRMGFKLAEAERAAAEVRGRESEALDVLVRDALRALSP